MAESNAEQKLLELANMLKTNDKPSEPIEVEVIQETTIDDIDDLVGNHGHVFVAPLMFDGEDWEIKGANQNGVAEQLIDMKEKLIKSLKG